ncbi:hypothetical protein [Streptomyces sp. MT206]|uniref:hypothetical protein n=1 Tax=Streptomyces sp. MT206 TaxID=3031407 RepID=UPI002FC8164D
MHRVRRHPGRHPHRPQNPPQDPGSQDPAPGLLGYANSHRSYTHHLAPARDSADIVLDGTQPTADLAAQLMLRLDIEKR